MENMVKELRISIIENSEGAFSTADKIYVNNIPEGYQILFKPGVFESLHDTIHNVVKSIINIFKKNVPNQMISINVVLYNGIASQEFDETIQALLKILSALKNLEDIDMEFNSFSDGKGKLINDPKAFDGDSFESFGRKADHVYYDDDAIDSMNDNDDYIDEEEEDIKSFLNSIYGINDDDDDRPKKKKDKSSYTKSRIWKNSDNLKKEINRHGVIISDSKKDIKADEKIIKEFLKEFLPGNSDWKKEFRKDVLDRWMQMYMIEKKQLKKFQKKSRKKRRRARRIDPNKAIDLTQRLFNTPISAWNDPTK